MTDISLYEKGSIHLRCFIKSFALTLLVIGFATARVHADLTISLSNATVTTGSIGTMNFTVTSNNSDTLSAFGLELLITPVGTHSSLLQFTSSQPDPYGNANYVFNSGSFGSDNGIPFWSSPGETHYPSDTITGGDMSDAPWATYRFRPRLLPTARYRIWPRCNSWRRRARWRGISFRSLWSGTPISRTSMIKTATP